MRAIAYTQAGAIDRTNALLDIELPMPELRERDLLIEVKAISVNPVDTKIRRNTDPAGHYKILGWDAAGIVKEVGASVTNFKTGDEVWYAGDLTRQGTNAQYHAVDERIVSLKPKSLSYAQAAAMPLTSITAWEMLFDRLQIQHAPNAKTVLIVGGAGGVGSIAIQLIKAKTPLKVIATASRPETQNWVKQLGADAVINHFKPMQTQIETLGLPAPTFVFSTNNSDAYVEQIAALMEPQGKFGMIDDPAPFQATVFKRKSISIHWEFMYTRSMFNTPDMAKQGQLLAEVATLVGTGKVQTTLNMPMGTINAKNLTEAHKLLESGIAIGKIVLEGF